MKLFLIASPIVKNPEAEYRKHSRIVLRTLFKTYQSDEERLAKELGISREDLLGMLSGSLNIPTTLYAKILDLAKEAKRKRPGGSQPGIHSWERYIEPVIELEEDMPDANSLELEDDSNLFEEFDRNEMYSKMKELIQEVLNSKEKHILERYLEMDKTELKNKNYSWRRDLERIFRKIRTALRIREDRRRFNKLVEEIRSKNPNIQYPS